ncbi:hypothetical protein GCM10010402_17590 [Actinomadura luteofluorescens]|uniref:DUF397 domain-containing protein n=1 Tax=Actinomadura luteofluorescens TaxID=46163 RepID=UPI00216481A9|nr:DUF397 domain-containing protein [Actinomadura glauciflava]MCR3739830.1 protein of unknown function (DUF397) [Actinomadura glauciflava]
MSVVWRKASRSNTQGDECVEVANLGGRVGMRDSKAPEAGHLLVSPQAFGALMDRLKRDDQVS